MAFRLSVQMILTAGALCVGGLGHEQVIGHLP
ncbi:MAG: hypothetical protein ACJARE_001637 [Paracoccaceae bacterium]|jgi:hypothetical protein